MILVFTILEDRNHFSTKSNIIFKTKKVNVLLGFPIFQDEKQALKVPTFKKQLKNIPSPVHVSNHMAPFFRSPILVSLAQRLLLLLFLHLHEPLRIKHFFVG